MDARPFATAQTFPKFPQGIHRLRGEGFPKFPELAPRALPKSVVKTRHFVPKVSALAVKPIPAIPKMSATLRAGASAKT
jgi:hypothetical protein